MKPLEWEDEAEGYRAAINPIDPDMSLYRAKPHGRGWIVTDAIGESEWQGVELGNFGALSDMCFAEYKSRILSCLEGTQP